MKQCQRCNLNFSDNLKFCESCGSALVEPSTQSTGSLRCPACGEPAKSGWRFCVKCRTQLPATTGDLAQANRPAPSPTLQLKSPLVSNVTRQPAEQIPAASPQASLNAQRTSASQEATVSNPQIRVRCRKCKKLVEEDAEFCEFCGAPMFEDTASETTQTSSQPPPPPPQPYQPQEWYAMTDTPQQTYTPSSPPRRDIVTPPPPTAHYRSASYSPAPPPPRETPPSQQPPMSTSQTSQDKAPPSLSMLSSYGVQDDTPPASFRWWHGVILLVFLLVFLGGLGAGGWWWWSSRKSRAAPNVSQSSSTSPSTGSMTEIDKKSATSSANDELKELRDRRISARPADGHKIVEDLENAEKKYPRDYRFPYERAKLSIKGVTSHHEAFEAIFLAAEKAIDNGKAQEMLSELTSDKDGDFYKMSRGHHEWETLEQALRNNDKSALKTNH